MINTYCRCRRALVMVVFASNNLEIADSLPPRSTRKDPLDAGVCYHLRNLDNSGLYLLKGLAPLKTEYVRQDLNRDSMRTPQCPQQCRLIFELRSVTRVGIKPGLV
ncbi:hypothetical protein K503DRAFT_509964 [Rhizopogon vinicolor AM-OR11-026]|uniref:Uncharacterized protein n=1 Tax=Rhizopogon vinicolor AM-OR11-026 TaxID=1314800 RepID=A0A1B7MM06_9AGAM|nr:hypothetical protein K503DRAFT_509964 [Rhizopogon vinicolor AM-OR11-026]